MVNILKRMSHYNLYKFFNVINVMVAWKFGDCNRGC